jgi:hypothetical protein
VKIRKSIWIALLVTLGIVVAAMFTVDVYTPQGKTNLAMQFCKRRVLRYAAEHGQLPSSLIVTQPIDRFESSIKDAWGVVIDYSVDANGTVKLVSLGKDRKPGGTGNNTDMVGTFPSKQAHGSWSKESVPWIHDPFEGFRTKSTNP